jgi:hypothetical protein
VFLEIVGSLAVMAMAPAQSPASVTSRADAPGAYRLFADRTVTVPVLVHASDPDSVDLRAAIVQLTSSLSMPLAVEMDVRLTPGATGHPWLDASVSLTLPSVEREADFEIRFRSRRRGDTVWQPAGRVTVRVYPADLLAPLREWARSHPISVRDDRGALVEFLRRQRIPLADRPGRRGVTLYVGSRWKDGSAPPVDGEAAILFTERETDTPHLLVDRAGRGPIVSVEMRFLDRLETDPLAQKLLLEAFRRLHEQLAPVEGVDR